MCTLVLIPTSFGPLCGLLDNCSGRSVKVFSLLHPAYFDQLVWEVPWVIVVNVSGWGPPPLCEEGPGVLGSAM